MVIFIAQKVIKYLCKAYPVPLGTVTKCLLNDLMGGLSDLLSKKKSLFINVKKNTCRIILTRGCISHLV